MAKIPPRHALDALLTPREIRRVDERRDATANTEAEPPREGERLRYQRFILPRMHPERTGGRQSSGGMSSHGPA